MSEPTEREPLSLPDDYATPPELLVDLANVRRHIENSQWINKPLCRGLVNELETTRTALRAAEDRADRYEKLHRSQRAKTATAESSLTRYKHFAEVARRKGIGCQDAEYLAAVAALEESPEDRDQ